MDTDSMKKIMEKFRTEIKDIEVVSENKNIKFTISAGVAGHKAGGSHNNTPTKILALADICLYAAKQDGRNCVKTRGDM